MRRGTWHAAKWGAVQSPPRPWFGASTQHMTWQLGMSHTWCVVRDGNAFALARGRARVWLGCGSRRSPAPSSAVTSGRHLYRVRNLDCATTIQVITPRTIRAVGRSRSPGVSLPKRAVQGKWRASPPRADPRPARRKNATTSACQQTGGTVNNHAFFKWTDGKFSGVHFAPACERFD